MALTLGTRLGPYEIVSALGAGGMGEVYRATDTKLKRQIALKILPASLAADPDRLARFQREAEVLASLNHPHIAQIHGLEDAGGIKALVMELVEGEDLAERIARGPIPLHEALLIAKQIAEALEAAHDQAIIHRDLKPANVKVRGDGTVKVLDFGLAKLGEADAARREGREPLAPAPTITSPAMMTRLGVILGTAAYMSPEQARGRPLDKRSDIWAFGCVLYEMLTGRRAFGGDTVTDTFVSILEREPDWAPLPSETSASIRTLLDRCLRKDPRKRLHDIADARIELDDVDRSVGGADGQVAAAAPHRTRERLAWIVAAVLGAVSCAMAVLYLRAMPPALGPLEFTIGPPENWVLTAKTPAPTFEISPDGRQVVVAASSQGVSMLWVRPIANPAWRQLPGTQGADAPFWSPDSQSLGFFANDQLKTVKVSGGETPVIICEARLGQIGSGAWSRDGVIVFGGTSPLRKVGVSGGNPTPVTTLRNGEIAHRWPSLLPDGEHFLYLAQAEGRSELRVGSVASTVTTSLGSYESHAVYSSGYLLFVRSGRLMAQRFDADSHQLKGDPLVVAEQAAIVIPWQRGQFSVSATGVLGYSRIGRPMSRLTWMDRTGKPVGTAGEPGFYSRFGLSPDDRRVAVSQVKEQPGGGSNVDIWLIDLARAGTAARLTFDAAREYDPAWSPDGAQIAFNSSRIHQQFSLWRRRSSGSGNEELLVKSDTSLTSPNWSPDDHFLLYTATDAATHEDLWTLPLSGDRKPEVFLKTPFTEDSGVFSPDGRWVAYTSNASGRSEVYVRPFPVGEGVYPVSRDSGRAPQWRDDGRELFFLTLDGTLMAARIKTAKGLQATVPEALFPTGFGSEQTLGYAPAKDGQRFLIPVRLNAPGSAPITVVLNWPATLRD